MKRMTSCITPHHKRGLKQNPCDPSGICSIHYMHTHRHVGLFESRLGPWHITGTSTLAPPLFLLTVSRLKPLELNPPRNACCGVPLPSAHIIGTFSRDTSQLVLPPPPRLPLRYPEPTSPQAHAPETSMGIQAKNGFTEQLGKRGQRGVSSTNLLETPAFLGLHPDHPIAQTN
jgi:hypothetical protein